MPAFSTASLQKLATVHPDLQKVMHEVIKHFDFTICVGHRNKQDQDQAFKDGKSQKKWPNSNHNKMPSHAVDIAPYPIDWNDRERFTYLAGHVKMAAHMLGVKVRWGGDWDKDNEVKDNSFDDLPHFELAGK